MSATLVLLTRRPDEARVARPQIRRGEEPRPTSAASFERRTAASIIPGPTAARTLEWGTRPYFAREERFAADRIKLSACNHDDRIINWSSSALSAQPESMLVGVLSCPRATGSAARAAVT